MDINGNPPNFKDMLSYVYTRILNYNIIEENDNISCRDICNIMFEYYYSVKSLKIIEICLKEIEESNVELNVIIATLLTDYIILLTKSNFLKKNNIQINNQLDEDKEKVKKSWDNFLENLNLIQ